jgi:hypothetical protein
MFPDLIQHRVEIAEYFLVAKADDAVTKTRKKILASLVMRHFFGTLMRDPVKFHHQFH